MNFKKHFCVLLILFVFLSSCGDVTEEVTSTPTVATEDFTQSSGEMFTDRDTSADYGDAVEIKLENNTAVCTSSGVKINGSKITLTEEKTYLISGSLENGSIIVETPDTAKPQLVLNGVTVTSADSAPIYIKSADKVFITLGENTENTLTVSGTFTESDGNNIDGVIFSKQDLTVNGSGSLDISCAEGHGIVCKDDLVFTGGSIKITCSGHGLDANDSVRIQNTSFDIKCGKDGIHSENSDDASLGFVYIESISIKVQCEGDGISAGAYLQIENGSFDILAGGGYQNGTKEHSDSWGGMPGRPGGRPREAQTQTESTSMKGLKGQSGVSIKGGSLTIDSADDGIHSNTTLLIADGSIKIASGDDGLHADTALTVTGGVTDITNSYEGLEGQNILISGGTVNAVASDDGLNAAGGTDQSGSGGRDNMFGGRPGGPQSSNSNGSIIISGGTVNLKASGDGIDANGTLEISGGYITVTGPTQGDTAVLDYDKTATVTGGTFIGTGSRNMFQGFSSCNQGYLTLSSSQSANTEIKVTDSSGNVIISHTPTLNFQVIILTCPEMKSGEVYTLTVGTESQEFTAK